MGFRRHGIAIKLALGASALALAPILQAGEPLNQRFRDGTYKFSFSYPSSWDPIPVEPGDRDTVCRFSQGDAEAKGVLPARVSILRSGPPPETTASDGAEAAPEEGDETEDDGGRDTTEDLVDVFNEILEQNEFEGSIEARTGKPVKSKDGVPGSVWELEATCEGFTAFHVFAVWQKPDGDVQIGMWLRSSVEQRKKHASTFQAMVQSFQWFDDKAKDVASLAVLKDLPLSPAKRRELEKGLVKGWNLIVSPKKQYIVVYNTLGKRNDALAKMIAERIERIRAELYEPQFPPVRPIEAISVVRICANRSEYRAYGAPPGSAGYWNPDAEELVFYDASPSKKLDEDTLAVCYHEAFHQYIHYSTGQVAPHSWFDEGHGDYYAGVRTTGGKLRILPFSWRIGLVKTAIRKGPCRLKEDGSFDRSTRGYTPLKDLVAFSQDDYYAYPGVSYAQGWSLVYFLREIVPKNATWKAKWGGILDTYFTTLRGTATAKPAAAPSEPVPPKPPGKAGAPDKPKEPAPKDPPAREPTDEPSDAPSEDSPGIVMPRYGEGGGNLDKALDEAFRGVDFAELEEAWKDSILSVPG